MKDSFCAKCGACTAVCPVYRTTGLETLTARGRLHLLEKPGGRKVTGTYRDIFSKCLLCGACREVCPRQIDIPAMVVEARHDLPQSGTKGSFVGSLLRQSLSRQQILAGLAGILRLSEPLLRKLPADSGLRLKLGLGIADHQPPQAIPLCGPELNSRSASADHLLFPGCLARHLDRQIISAAAGLITAADKAAPTTPREQTCCGLASFSAGDIDEARRLARLNIAAYEGSDAPIIVLCGSCFSHLAGYADLLAGDGEWHSRAASFCGRLREISSFLAAGPGVDREISRTREEPGLKRVVYQDPCHLRYRPGLREAPRKLLSMMPGVRLVELEHGPQCCGFGGLFNLAHPDLSGRISARLVADITAADPDLVVTTCSGCLIQLREKLGAAGSRAQVIHLALLLAAGAGPGSGADNLSF